MAQKHVLTLFLFKQKWAPKDNRKSTILCF